MLFFLQNPLWIKYYPAWRKSLIIKRNNPQATTLDIELPWFTYGAINWLRNYLKPGMKVFEYGTGGSTLFLLKRDIEFYSVEHDKDWYFKIASKIHLSGVKTTNIKLIKPTYKKERGNFKYKSETFKTYKNYSFEKYAKAINVFENDYFDLVVVDGRARSACMKIALKKIKKGGYLLLDNSERLAYKLAIEKFNRYKRREFLGFGPYSDIFWKTTIWEIK